MRMAIVLPKTQSDIYFQRFQTVFQRDHPEIDVQYLFYSDYKEAPGLLQDHQHEYDAVIFAGSASFYYAQSCLRQETIWLYLPREGSAIYRALLLALKRGWDITRLSFDTYEYSMLLEAYHELGYPEDKLRIQYYTHHPRSPDYNKLVLDFHRDCLSKGLVSGCITRLTTVANMMERYHVPYIFAHPTIDTIREQVAFGQKLVVATQGGLDQFAVLAVDISLPVESSAFAPSEYSFSMDRLHIARQVYRYAELIRGTVLEQGPGEYVLFSTKELLESQTGSYQRLALLDQLVKEFPYCVSIGVGCSKTAAEARRLSLVALRRSIQRRKSGAVLQFSDGTSLYIRPGGTAPDVKATASEQWQEAAQRTHLSANTIARIAELTCRRQDDRFTARQLAEGLGISRRSADRILERLEAQGYATAVGQEVFGERGRPARIMQVFLLK